MAGKRIEVSPDDNGELPTLSLAPGESHTIVVKFPTVFLDHRYHDDTPIQNAPFEVECTNGAIVKGNLGEDGTAEVRLPAPPKHVRYGSDTREYQRVGQKDNPTYRPSMSDADAAALVDRYFSK